MFYKCRCRGRGWRSSLGCRGATTRHIERIECSGKRTDSAREKDIFNYINNYCSNPTATLLEHALLAQGFMDTSKAAFPRRWRPQSRDSTWANLLNTPK